MKKMLIYILLFVHVFVTGNIWSVENHHIAQADVGDIGHWKDSVWGQIPGTTFAGFNFNQEVRNDGIYTKPNDSTIQFNEAWDYLVIATTHDDSNTNDRYNPQLRVEQISWTWDVFTSYYTGYSRSLAEDESWVRAVSVVIGASANSQIQVQKRRDIESLTWWSVANNSDVQVIRITQNNYWLYRTGWTGNLYAGTTPNTVSIDTITSQSDTSSIEWDTATNTISLKGDNKKYLIAWANSFNSGSNTRTQRIWHLEYNGVDKLSTRAYCYGRDVNNEYCWLGSMDIIETWTADITVQAEIYKGDWVWADQGWANSDGANKTDGNGQMIVLELPEYLEVFRSEDSVGLQQINSAQTFNIARDVNFSDSASFTKNTDTQVRVTNPADIFSWANIWTARNNVATVNRQTSFGSVTIDGVEQTTWRHGSYSRWNQWSTDTFALSFHPAGIYTTTWVWSTLWVNSDPIVGWSGGWEDRTQPWTLGFFALNFDTLVAPVLHQSSYRWFENINSNNVGTPLAIQDIPATLSTDGQAFRLRSLISLSDNKLRANEKDFKLQFAQKVWVCDTSFLGENYIDVTNSTAIAFNDNSLLNDENVLTANINDPVIVGRVGINQTYQEANNFTTSAWEIPKNQDGKWDFSLIDNTAPVATSYCFRMVESDGKLLDVYREIPEITTALPVTSRPFITTWKTDNAWDSSDTQITIPTVGVGYNYDIDCNSDGIPEAIGVTGNYTCDYPIAGTYTVEITGDFPRILFADTWDKLKILSIEQWWDIEWTSMQSAFFGATNMEMAAIDSPDLSNVTTLGNMFLNVTWPFSWDLTWWDVSNITLMANIFWGTQFNQDISTWDVSNVTDMRGVFSNTSAFNQDISTWDTSSATNMQSMFLNTEAFNQDISAWDTSNVTVMQSMFQGTKVFNTPIVTTPGWWNTSNVTNMQNMFVNSTAFNQDVRSWDTSSVTTMQAMFQNVDSFNQPLNTTPGWWNVGNVTNFSNMFLANNLFNQDLSSWDTSSAVNMGRMFQSSFIFDQDLSAWDISNVTNMANMLDNTELSIANYDATLIGWNAQSVQPNVPLGAISLEYCAGNAARANLISSDGWTISGDIIGCTPFITTWKTDNVWTSTDTQITIPTTGTGYNYDIDCDSDGILEATGVTWDYTCDYPVAGTYTVEIFWDFPRMYTNNQWDKLKILSVDQWGDPEWIDMTNAFFGATNLDIAAADTPNLSNVTSLQNAFRAIEWPFSWDMTTWDVSNVTNMSTVFTDSTFFNQNLSTWDTSKVTRMNSMFQSTNFNQPLISTPGWWNTSSVELFQFMFNAALVFNQDVSSWDTSSATSMQGMFANTRAFNQDISSFDTSNVTNLSQIFQNADAFNTPIVSTPGWWDTSNVANFSRMFLSANIFNQDLSTWDTSNVETMSDMFLAALQFDQDLSAWDISWVGDMTNMLDNSNLSIANYDATLIWWDAQIVEPNITLGSIGLVYCSAVTERSNLISSDGWTIIGDENCNQDPTDIILSNDTIDENVPAATAVWTLSTTDADLWDTHTYSLVSGTWDTDNIAFTLTGNTLTINASPDFETQSSYSVRIQTDDGNGWTFEKVFIISINDLDEVAPVISNTNFASGALLPGWNHDIVVNYSDVGSWIDTTSATIELLKWDWVSAYGPDISSTWISIWNISVSSATYDTNDLEFWKYQYTFSISDNTWNISTETVVFYIDIPEFIVSTPDIDIWNLNSFANTFSDTVTVTVKTVWAWFDVSMENPTSLNYGFNYINQWDGTIWFGHDFFPYTGSISTIGAQTLIQTEWASINTNWDKNIYSYPLKIWALIDSQQVAWEYMWNIDFSIDFNY